MANATTFHPKHKQLSMSKLYVKSGVQRPRSKKHETDIAKGYELAYQTYGVYAPPRIVATKHGHKYHVVDGQHVLYGFRAFVANHPELFPDGSEQTTIQVIVYDFKGDPKMDVALYLILNDKIKKNTARDRFFLNLEVGNESEATVNRLIRAVGIIPAMTNKEARQPNYTTYPQAFVDAYVSLYPLFNSLLRILEECFKYDDDRYQKHALQRGGFVDGLAVFLSETDADVTTIIVAIKEDGRNAEQLYNDAKANANGTASVKRAIANHFQQMVG